MSCPRRKGHLWSCPPRWQVWAVVPRATKAEASNSGVSYGGEDARNLFLAGPVAHFARLLQNNAFHAVLRTGHCGLLENAGRGEVRGPKSVHKVSAAREADSDAKSLAHRTIVSV
ncbi:hypothetical protein AVEN_45021-1 [Araneus ventricosus]|uniref:Uncharacterized protein n=1 Tax=Araneus ventricosus TaxID=182803 RepID=A0A4Y2I7A2_ARAVE|nr:hypothetical protein AVEN_45021-1 [Araneus ventricosus]